MSKFGRPVLLLFLTFFSASIVSAENLRCETLFNSSYQKQQEIAMNLARLRIEIYTLEGDEKRLRMIEFDDLFPQFADMVSSLSEANHLLAEALKKLGQEKENLSQKAAKEKESKRLQKSEEEFIKYSVIDGTRGIMHRIEPGSFKMGEVGKQVDVTITKPFEMMATVTTQVVWEKVGELASQKFGRRYQILPNPSKFNGDTRPIDSISYDAVQVWLKALNELSTNDEPALVDIFPGHAKGDVYRLPTEAEWEFVVRGRGKYQGKYYFENPDKLDDHAWFNENADSETHPVALKKPLVVDGKEFYDLYGNVFEWVRDWHDSKLIGGRDPQGPITGNFRVLRGGSLGAPEATLSSELRGNGMPSLRHYVIGFRLVRTSP